MFIQKYPFHNQAVVHKFYCLKQILNDLLFTLKKLL